MTKIAADPSHPRYQSLLLRHRLEEAEKKGIKMPKLYYALEKIRAGLLQCIGQTMKKEGWSDA